MKDSKTMKNIFFKDDKINRLNPLMWVWVVLILLVNIIAEIISGVIKAFKLTKNII